MDLLFIRKFYLRKAPVRLFLCCLVINSLCVSGIYSLTRDVGWPKISGSKLVAYGGPLELFCSDEGSSEDLSFNFGGTELPSEIVNGTTRRFYIELHRKGVFNYYCRNKKTNKIGVTRVLVDSPPADVTDFKCRSMNIEELNCTWSSSDYISISSYIVKIQSERNGMDYATLTPKRIGRNTFYFLLTTTSRPLYRQMDAKFFFKLIVSNAFGEREQNFTVDHFSVVQPAHVMMLQAKNVGRNNALLTWKIPNNIHDFMPGGVEHKIQYRYFKVDNGSSFRTVDSTSLPLRNKTYRFQLEDLPYSNMQYEVRIFIRPVQPTGIWSDFSYLLFMTTGKF